MAVGGEGLILGSLGIKALLGGNIADEADFASGGSTAQFLRQGSNNALSDTSGTINCTFFTLADIVAKAGRIRSSPASMIVVGGGC
ncbi:hypothetical protein [Oricola cellulosilytica]|uniref:Uncharacterized protein n=1 Tax=Oricola cellulosilytica TaxID=1429082 RepID=A0A4R0PFP2_9HYPH|nr:hypothetical protein [Oricola cellulosilytica]TCD16656.1 hypothetical protein E0D97_04390 [Oricola cellulosilytica]